MLRNTFTSTLIAAVLLAPITACSPKPEIQLAQSLEELEYIMRSNVQQPDILIQKLNEFNASHQNTWASIHDSFKNMDEEHSNRALDQQQERIRNSMLKIVNLDLEIQDRLANDPVRLNQYTDAVQYIGYSKISDN